MPGPPTPWTDRNAGTAQPQPYGCNTTYALAASWLKPCAEVQDWGSGLGWFKAHFRPDAVCVDSAPSKWTDLSCDMTLLRVPCDGILLRHVLEHNANWREILDNALWLARQRVCLVLFTPFDDRTYDRKEGSNIGGVEVTEMSFARGDLEDTFSGWRHFLLQDIPTNTQFGIEHVYFLERQP